MARKLRIPSQALPSIEAIGNNFSKLPLLKVIAEELDPGKSSPERISTLFAAKADLSQTDALKIVSQVLGFHGLRTTFGMTPSSLYKAITDSIVGTAAEKWKDEHLENWKKSKDAVIAALDPSHPFTIIEKRTRLTYEHQNVLYDANILTDVRPIFDETAKDIAQLSITHVIGIEYSDGTHRHQLFAAMDSTDVAKLKRACDRAQTKEITLKSKLKGFQGPIILAGELDDE
jgi:hypothetical protein